VFVDQAIITLRAGNGGNGAATFRREKFDPKGGPNGGNGGDGGDVVLQAEPGMSTLYDFRNQAVWAADDGENGGGKQCSGGRGQDLILKLPPGTMLFDSQADTLVHDLKEGERVIIAKGGRGGWGNEHFKRSNNQTPRSAEHGEPGQRLRVRLELKLIAEIGFVGLPNAGKSTLLASLTKATPKIANYPFTTLSPQLGVCELDATRRMVIADIPGLIEGASEGKGVGHDFLRHIERTKVIVHLLDVHPDNSADPAVNYETIREELKAYSQILADKPEVIAINKMDLLLDDKERTKALKAIARATGARLDRDIFPISGATREGLRPFLERLWTLLHPGSEQLAGWKPVAAE